MTHDLILLVLNALAVFRLTRLFTRDTITAPLRGSRRVGEFVIHPEALFDCPWCVSFWAAILVVVATATWTDWPYAAAVLAFSAVAGIVSERT